MGIGQYTDEDIIIDIEGGTLVDIHGIHVTFAQDNKMVDVIDPIIVSDTQLAVPLTQVQTGQFNADRPVKVQLNYFTSARQRKKSEIATIGVESNLLRRILTDG